MEYTIKYQEVLEHEFEEIELERFEDAHNVLMEMDGNGEIDWSHGELTQACVTEVIAEDGTKKVVNEPFASLSKASTIKIPLSDGFKLVAEKNQDINFKSNLNSKL